MEVQHQDRHHEHIHPERQCHDGLNGHDLDTFNARLQGAEGVTFNIEHPRTKTNGERADVSAHNTGWRIHCLTNNALNTEKYHKHGKKRQEKDGEIHQRDAHTRTSIITRSLLIRGTEEKRVHRVVLVVAVTVVEGGTAAGRWGQNVPETRTRMSHKV